CEEYIDKQKLTESGVSHAKQMLIDVKEGFRYLRVEKGLLAVALYFTFNAMTGGVESVIVLPFFKDAFSNGDYLYSLVMGMSVVGRAIGGMIHYKVNMPVKWKFSIAFGVYILLSVFYGVYLFLPVPLMMFCCFMTGILGVTSYTIRISATQSYVPDERKGRFNGAFNMLNTVGSLAGELLAGALAMILPVRTVFVGFQVVCAIAAVVFIGGGRKHIAPIYNRQQ
ncbi:MAG: MFS transporter, partial [Clostridiales bacterium]|nr:MFS transporter [Clostridiales bacterium]